jgi:hypothetical protein
MANAHGDAPLAGTLRSGAQGTACAARARQLAQRKKNPQSFITS